MFRFTIRDLLWLMLVAGMFCYGYRDRQLSAARVALIRGEIDAKKAILDESQQTLNSKIEDLENKIASQAVPQKLNLISQQLERVREYSAKCVITERIKDEFQQHHLTAQIRRPYPRPWPDPKDKRSTRMARLTFLSPSGDKTLELTAHGTEPSSQWAFKHLLIPPEGSEQLRLEDDLRNAVAWGVGLDEILKRFRDRYTKEITLPGVKINTYEVIPDNPQDDSPLWERFAHLYCEIIHSEKRPRFDCHMARLVIDQKTRLPVQISEYDWPTHANDKNPPLIWSVELKDIDLNPDFPLP